MGKKKLARKTARPRTYRPFIPEFSGPPFDPGETTDPDCYGIFGRSPFIEPDCPKDGEGLPLTTEFFIRAFDWRVECLERECREILAKYGADPLPTAPLPSRPPDDEFDKDAYRVLRLARGLRKRFAEGDVRGAIIHAFELGMIVQRMNARWAERFAHSGRKGGLKTSIKARDMKRLKASERRAEIRRMVEAEIKRQPGLQRARLVVAKRIDAASLPEDDRNERHTPKCWSTVVRATKGMKKISK